MTVALATAKKGDIHSVTDLFGQVDFIYLCMLLVVLVLGPGAASLDGAIAHAIDGSRRKDEAPADLEHALAR